MLECLQFLSHVTQIWYIEVTYQIVMSSKNIFCFDTNRKAASKLAWPVYFKILAKFQLIISYISENMQHDLLMK